MNLDMQKTFINSVKNLSSSVDKFNWENPDCYRFWLAQTNYLVLHTTRLICLAAANCPISDRERHYSYIEHLKEETNHDILIQQDLKHFSNTKKIPEALPETEVLLNNQYFWLDRGGVAALLGYSLTLEGLAATIGEGVLDRVEKAHGKKASTFLHLHVKVDQDHYEEGLKLIHQFSNEEIQLIEKNLNQSSRLYISMLNEIEKIVLPATTSKVLKVG